MSEPAVAGQDAPPGPPAAGGATPTVFALHEFRLLVVFGGIFAFVGIYVYFLYEVWSVSDTTPADLDKQITYLASAVGGVLATYFAFVLGIRQQDDETRTVREALSPGDSLQRGPQGVASGRWSLVGSVAFWAYALVGIATLVTASVKGIQTPDTIKATAAVFGGYLAAVFGGYLAAVFGSAFAAATGR
jgi:hypothetical protein